MQHLLFVLLQIIMTCPPTLVCLSGRDFILASPWPTTTHSSILPIFGNFVAFHKGYEAPPGTCEQPFIKARFRYLLICFLSNWYLVKSKVLVKSCVTPSIWQIGSCLPASYGVLVKNTSTLWQETEINWARTSAGKQLPICQIDGVNEHCCPTSTNIFVLFHCMTTRWCLILLLGSLL